MAGQYLVRRVRPSWADARALTTVERLSLGDSAYTPREMLAILLRPEHHCYLALLGEEAVGFCSCIETPTTLGGRLEIDMLGVLAEHRRRGLGRAMVARALHDARRRGVTLARGVVAADNLASQKLFREQGLVAPSSPHEMLVCLTDGGDQGMPALAPGWEHRITRNGRSVPAHRPPGRALGRELHELVNGAGAVVGTAETLQVATLSYRGLWLERLWASTPADAERMARAIAARGRTLGMDEVGHLAPVGPDTVGDVARALRHAGYEPVGRYYVFCGDRL